MLKHLILKMGGKSKKVFMKEDSSQSSQNTEDKMKQIKITKKVHLLPLRSVQCKTIIPVTL